MHVRAPRPAEPVIGDLGCGALVLPGDTPSGEIEALFRADRALRAVVINDAGIPSLLTRAQLDHRMTGRLGYGRALNARVEATDLLPPPGTLLPPSLDLRAAAAVVLARQEQHRYEDLLVLAADGPRIVPVSEIFEGLSVLFRQAALHDPLTGLANRRHLEEQGPPLVGATDSDSSPTAILYVDLDDFKITNDTFGHRTGDAVLAEFSARLRACTRPADLVTRLGGDEFAVLLVDVDEATARSIAQRILASLAEPLTHDGHDLRLTATLGLAMSTDIDDGTPAARLEDLLRLADTAMLQAKHDGKRRLGRIDPCRPAARFARQALIRRRLPHALANAGFSLHYQPFMNISTGSCTAVEALLRWEDQELGKVSPVEFIHVAEHTGDIHAIGRWVIDTACAQARRWADAGSPRAISVNISPVQLAAGNLVHDLQAALRRHGVPASLVNIEITETAAITDLPSAAAQLQALIDAGIGVALDDYGTAYSSLAMLRDLPLTGLKLDKSFIDLIDTDPTSAILVAGIITTAKAMSLTMTAEGVERDAQLAVLRQLGCDNAQGYLISVPLPAQEIDLTQNTRTAAAGYGPPGWTIPRAPQTRPDPVHTPFTASP